MRKGPQEHDSISPPSGLSRREIGRRFSDFEGLTTKEILEKVMDVEQEIIDNVKNATTNEGGKNDG